MTNQIPADLDIDDIDDGIPIIGSADMAEYCTHRTGKAVSKKMVDEWCENTRIFPARFKNGSFRIRNGDLREWCDNNFNPPTRATFNKEVSIDIISTFQEYEVGKNCMSPTSYRMPLEWKPKIDVLLEHFKQFDGKLANFIRCAVFNLIMDLDELNKLGGMQADPRFATIAHNARVRDKHNTYAKSLEDMKKTISMMRRSIHLEDIKTFLDLNSSHADKWEEPWKSRAEKMLKRCRAMYNESKKALKHKEVHGEADYMDEDDDDLDDTVDDYMVDDDMDDLDGMDSMDGKLGRPGSY